MKRARMVLGGQRGALGGSERVADGIERILRREGWDIDWLCPADLPSVPRSARYPGLNQALQTWAVRRKLRDLPAVDLTVSHGMYGTGAGGPRVHVYHGTYPGLAEACRAGLPRLDYLVLTQVNGRFERWSGKGAHRVAVSRRACQEVERFYGLKGQRTVHNAVDVDLLAPVSGELRKRWALPEDRFLLLAVGRMDFGKGREVARAMLESLPESVMLVVAGPQHSKMETFPQDRVRIIAGVPYEELPALYSACDAVLCASLYEGFGLTLIEAWACGLPVVTGRVGIVDELLGEEPAFDACVAEVGDAAGLASAVNRLLQDPELRRRQAEWGRETVHARFSLPKFERDYLDVCHAALDAAASGVRAVLPAA
jgi:glycosyltransferase involved in cell wall biosynthesis